MMRIGIGEDTHLLVEGRKLILGGVEIPFEKGLLGHSDADVVLHALSDALLGALALGDIGHLFPPSDPSIEGIDSRLILSRCVELIREKGYHVVNADIVIVLEKPKMKDHLPKMRETIASLLGVDMDQVGIQAKTNEGCDAIGQGKAIRANAVALLEKGEQA